MSKKDFKSIPTWKSCRNVTPENLKVRLLPRFYTVFVPLLFLVFSGFSSIATATKPRIERSVTLFSVVPIASHVTQKGQQQLELKQRDPQEEKEEKFVVLFGRRQEETKAPLWWKMKWPDMLQDPSKKLSSERSANLLSSRKKVLVQVEKVLHSH